MNAYDIIRHKRDGKELSTGDITSFVTAAANNEIPDYQIAAWLMAAFIRGLNDRETADLTLAMAKSGETINLQGLGRVIDKHSTGGVADTTTLIVCPLVAACGVPVAKLTGRGLGHTGGTVDKLESIAGLTTELSIEDFVGQVERIGIGLISATKQLAPADAVFYALRDVTATVDSIPLIASSIMSKKIASGATHVVLDVKVGTGAFMKSQEKAEELATKMVEVGRMTGRATVALLTAMNEPLGDAIGNALEVAEALKILRNEGGSQRLREVSLALAGEMVLLHDSAKSSVEAETMLISALESGKAYEKFVQLVTAQGGDLSKPLPVASIVETVHSAVSGYVTSIDALGLGTAAMELGAGRKTRADRIDPAAGIVLKASVGSFVNVGDELAVLHTNQGNAAVALRDKVRESFTIADEKVSPDRMVLKTVRSVL